MLSYQYLVELVTERVQESLELEFKGSDSLARESKRLEELSRDVSAMANSAGGRLIYGIEEAEEDGVPIASAVDEGCDPEVCSRSWLEDNLQARIQPRIAGLKISQIAFPNGRVGYVIDVPQATSLAPHQASDRKYYKRFNFKREAMHDYEVRDLFRRATSPDLFLRFEVAGVVLEGDRQRAELEVWIGNRSNTPAEHSVVSVLLPKGTVIRMPPGFQQKLERVAVGNQGAISDEAVFFRPISTQMDLPIFREIETMLGSFEVRIPLNAPYQVRYSVRAPGCATNGRGEIVRQEDGVLKFVDS